MTDERGGKTKAERIAAARAALAQRYAENPEAVQRFNARMANIDKVRKRERERFEHLVLATARPKEKVTVGKRQGRRRPKTMSVPVELSPGIEQAVVLKERWAHHANGTPETWQAAGSHTDSLDQLERNGTIDKEQREWAAEIGNVHRSIEADVGVKVASLEARVDQSRRSTGVIEGVRRVRMHLAYGLWRDSLPMPKALVLDMIVGDTVGYTVAARRYRVHQRKAKRLLIAALNDWPRCVDHAYRTWSDEDIEAARNAAE